MRHRKVERILASLVLAIGLTSSSTGVALALQDDDSNPPAQPAAEPTASASEEEPSSNVVPLLIGAILLGGGVWAYLNKKQRFPGTRFRE